MNQSVTEPVLDMVWPKTWNFRQKNTPIKG